MPNHVHLLGTWPDPALARTTLLQVLRKIPGSAATIWDCPKVVLPMNSPVHHLRSLKYIALNPVRDGLCRDPLEFYWSTYRDYLGATATPWVDGRQLAAHFDQALDPWRDWFQTYLAKDASRTLAWRFTPTSQGEFTPERPQWPVHTLGEIYQAAMSAHRAHPMEFQKRKNVVRTTFLALARANGWRSPTTLGHFLQITPNAVYQQLQKKPNAAAYRAAWICLGDERLWRSYPWLGPTPIPNPSMVTPGRQQKCGNSIDTLPNAPHSSS